MKKLKERSGVYGKGIMFSSGVSTLTAFSRRPRFISNHCGELMMWWLSVESIHCLSKTVDESSVIQRMCMVSMFMCSKSPPAFTYASSAGTVQATSQVSWRCLTIVPLRQTCCIHFIVEARFENNRFQKSRKQPETRSKHILCSAQDSKLNTKVQYLKMTLDETKLIQEIVSDIQKKLSHELSLSLDAEGLVGMKSRGTGSKVESISLNLLAITKEMILSPTAFEGIICKLKCLTKLNLGRQPKLASLPDNIGELRSLVKLRLASLPDNIGALKSLKWLNLDGCSGLTSLPDRIGELKSLEELHLNGCSGLTSLPDNIGALKSLKWLLLDGCSGLASLPDNIGELKSLENLDLNGCSGLTSLPDNIGALKSLKWLKPDGCSGLASLPDRIDELKSLEELDLNGCSRLASLPDNIGALKSLKWLILDGCSGLASLPDNIGKLKSLKWLDLNGCSGLASLPDNIGALKSLKWLLLDGCSGLASLPDNIDELKYLENLDLNGCSGLASLPDNIGALKSLKWLKLDGCSGLASLPDRIGELKSLEKLDLNGCSGLTSLPDNIDALKSLKWLKLDGCSGLASLSDRIGELKSLEELDLNGCSGLASLPDNIVALKSLKWLKLDGCSGLASLPDRTGELKSLKSLHLSGFSELASLPDSIGALKSLESLSLHGWSGLASLPDSIGRLKSLTWLNLSDCSGLKSLPDNIVELKHLTTLILSGCLKLASLPKNFFDLKFKGLDKQPCYMLRGFQKVEEIASSTYKLGCHEFLNLGNSRVLKTLESLGSLVSLTKLILSKIDFERIHVSIKHLTKLSKLYLVECKQLQCLPELPSTLKVLIASGCISLKSVASISMQGDREYEVASQEFNFSNCLQLDHNSRTRIMGDARLRIQRMATSLFYQAYHVKPIRVRLCIPGSEVPECFSYKNREGSSVKLRQPAHWHRGFTLCAVVSFGQSRERRPINIECKCHLIINDGTQIDLSSYYYDKFEALVLSPTIWKRDQHVFIWSVHCKCFFKEASFHFKSVRGATDVVVEYLTFQMIEEICDRIKTVQISDSSPSLSSTTGETINSEEESVSNRIRQVSPSQGPTPPILQKIINLSDKIQNLKKEHSNLSNQVKTAKDSFLGPNILDTLQKLGNEYELLKKKYLQELSERKRLYNEVIELKGNIRVFCRCRPLNQVEITHGSSYVVDSLLVEILVM
ncbi:hypothetical protein NC653_012776 [Populus alba x Populus x berolinensis]|uniref:Kinesin motor domain-containing protein n=1 Tax=Populus alba x Populus x berolinensis TaxID=444605 RepID=A0AAD6QT55_9ROSI|nr:hypothetical protein NC653_012776 [Populus alba x Populus x berolinensis]